MLFFSILHIFWTPLYLQPQSVSWLSQHHWQCDHLLAKNPIMAFQFLPDKIQNLASQTKLFTIWPWLPLLPLLQPSSSSHCIYRVQFSRGTDPGLSVFTVTLPSSNLLRPLGLWSCQGYPSPPRPRLCPVFLRLQLPSALGPSNINNHFITLISVSVSHEKPRTPSHPQLKPMLSIWFIFASSSNTIWHANTFVLI